MLTKLEVENRLENWGKYVHQTIRPADPVLIERCLKLTYSKLSDGTAPIKEFDGLNLDALSDSVFGRAITLRGKFGGCYYNAIEIAMLLDVHFVVVLALLEHHGLDFGQRMNVKLLGRVRGEHTLFYFEPSCSWHTPRTFAHVHDVSMKYVIRELEKGRVPVPSRCTDDARRSIAKRADTNHDGFGYACNILRLPLYSELHINRTSPKKPPTPVAGVPLNGRRTNKVSKELRGTR